MKRILSDIILEKKSLACSDSKSILKKRATSNHFMKIYLPFQITLMLEPSGESSFIQFVIKANVDHAGHSVPQRLTLID